MASAVEALRITLTREEIGKARTEYLGFVRRYAGLSDPDRWVDFSCLLVYKMAIRDIATGDFDPDIRVSHLRHAYAMIQVVATADTVDDDVAALTDDEREFLEQIKQAEREGKAQ